MVTERDVEFCSEFMRRPVPKGHSWMNKYFKTRTKRLFLKYFLLFGCTFRFSQHCGEVCTKRYIKKMKRQFNMLKEKYERARAELDFDALERIEKGRCRLN